MSGADRKEVRAQARAALELAPDLAGFTAISAWVQSVDVDALPAWALATPRETRERKSHDKAQEDLTLAVVIKRLGGDDIEDILDDDSAAVEEAIVPALRSNARDAELAHTEIKLDGEGARRVGTLTMAFTVTYWTDDLV
jgi:hypothetical protein